MGCGDEEIERSKEVSTQFNVSNLCAMGIAAYLIGSIYGWRIGLASFLMGWAFYRPVGDK